MKNGSLLNVLLDILFPRRCTFCSKLLQKCNTTICENCQKNLPWLTGTEAEQKFEFVTMCVSPLRYQNEVRDSIHRYKFSDRSLYASTYGHLMSQCIADHLQNRFDLITWVPLSRKRFRKRGYDQAKLLAEAIADELQVEAMPVLRKRRNTSQQSRIDDASKRRANVLGAYDVVAGDKIEDMRVLLVDDVVTTGATLSECARMLRTFGASDVVCVTLCRARQEHK